MDFCIQNCFNALNLAVGFLLPFFSKIIVCMLFINRLTEREKKDLKYKRDILKLAKDHKAAGARQHADRYYIPADDVVSSYSVFESLHLLSFSSTLVLLVYIDFS